MDMRLILKEIHRQIRKDIGKGRVADYIPALARVPADKFAMTVYTVSGETYAIGDANETLSVQSVTKVLALAMVLPRMRNRLWRRVGVEPSGDPFNSLVQLEHEQGIPRNPFINAGAIVVTDCLCEHEANPLDSFLSFVRKLAGGDRVSFDLEVARSEQETGHRNAAVAHFLKSHGNLRGDVDEVLETYFHQCSLTMTCAELARAFAFLANHGVIPSTGERVVGSRDAKRLNAIMLTCGLYDAVGRFAYRVGIPAKSGVGGAIVGVVPGRFSVAVWSPGLDSTGNSLVGTKALELFTTKTRISVF